jgi:hypothetical protein
LCFPGFKNHLIIERFGKATQLKNLGLQIAKELYSANSKLAGAHADPSRQTPSGKKAIDWR